MTSSVVTKTRKSGSKMKSRMSDGKGSTDRRQRLHVAHERVLSSEISPSTSIVRAQGNWASPNGQQIAASWKISDPRSSHDSSPRSGSKLTGSDINRDLCDGIVVKNHHRRSETPSPSASLVHTHISSHRNQPPVDNYRSTGRRFPRRKPKNLNLSFIPEARLNAIAYRGDSDTPVNSMTQTYSMRFVDPFSSEKASKYSEKPQKVTKRPSPRSLREARLKRFSKPTDTERPEQECFSKPHPARPFASYVPTPERSRVNSRAVTDRTRHHMNMLKKRANVEVRLANIAVAEIAGYAYNGYVVDIISSFIVEELPMSSATRALAEKYIRWGQAKVAAGSVNVPMRYVADMGDPWQQWAYISRLPIADIGRDGRRRTLTHDDEAEEHWTVLLVPLRTWQANDLREALLAQPFKKLEEWNRRQSLGSEIANSMKSPVNLLY